MSGLVGACHNSPFFNNLLRRPWDTLSEEDVVHVRDCISAHEEDITGIDRRISHLIQEINALHSRKKKHEDAIRQHRGVVSAARRLPPEVLADIIVHCVGAGWWRAPAVLARLSNAWAHAVRFPRVWAAVYVDCEDEDVLPRTRLWLARARGAALDIVFRPASSEHATLAAMHLLSPAAPQIRSFKLDAPTVSDAQLVLAHCPAAMAALEWLCISARVDPDDAERELTDVARIFEASSKLRHMRIMCDRVDAFVSLPSTITHIEIGIVPYTLSLVSCIQQLVGTVLPALPGLESLRIDHPAEEIDGEDAWETSAADIAPVALVNLRSLHLRAAPGLSVILDKLDAPALTDLSLSSPVSPAAPHVGAGVALCEFLARCAPPLRLLDLYDVDLPEPAFLVAFGRAPALAELRLHWSDVSDVALGALGVGLCPRLSRLDLRWCSHLEGRTLVELVRAREAASADVARIEEIAVLNCPFVEEPDVLELAELTTCRVTLRPHGDQCCESGPPAQSMSELTRFASLAELLQQ
jgi:hypothetical protein